MAIFNAQVSDAAHMENLASLACRSALAKRGVAHLSIANDVQEETLEGTNRHQDFAFVPQGAGDARTTHRCPGEAFTTAIMREATRLLVEEMEYAVPQQDLDIPRNRIPARPSSGLLLADVRRKP